MDPPAALSQGRWTGLWNRLGASGDGLPAFNRLMSAYAEPTRRYHNSGHILDCLAQLDLAPAARHPDEVEAALWFHDAVYLPGQPDNEARSADLARVTLIEAGVPPEVVDRVADLVLATRHSVIPTEADAQLVCDVDLSILGRAREVFDEFERRIRQEYSWVPEPVYRSARTEILQGFLRRSSVYQTKFFRDRYGGPARTNLARQIKELGG